MKRIKIAIVVVIGILLVTCSTANKDITVQTPDLSSKEDGVYRGNYDLSGTPVKVTLDVVVQNNQINSIELLKHTCSPIGKKAEKIIDTILQRQNLDVDVITGATGSSRAILKAVENALE